MNTKIILVLILYIMAVSSGCIENKKISENETESLSYDKYYDNFEYKKLKKFSSIDEIKEFLKIQYEYREYQMVEIPTGVSSPIMAETIPGVTPGVTPLPVGIPPGAVPAAVPAYAPSYPKDIDYSKTNIQVENVDEADFIKNDGKYIYMLKQNVLLIIEAFPAENAKIISAIFIEGRPKEIFLNDDKVIIFTEKDDNVIAFPKYDYRPIYKYTPMTTVLIYDMADKRKPELLTNYNINGYYFRSRMIDKYIYFIVKNDIYYDDIRVPVINKGSTKMLTPDIYYFDNPEQNYIFHTIASIDLKNEKINAKSFMMGYSDNLYVSKDNIYITYKRNLPPRYYEIQRADRFYKIIVPLLPIDAQKEIKNIKESDTDKTDNTYEKWDKISSIMVDTYNNMDEDERQDYMENVEMAILEDEIRFIYEIDKTIIQKININKGDIEYKTSGEVPGSILNQFSMDEYGDYFRIATTTQFWKDRPIQYNNVYILNKDLGIAGKLEKIAPDEIIYSTRFIADRLYMVTFRRIDPFFVINLDPSEPKILGKLKIPGYSDYLHPYDENHIIGIGKETEEFQWEGEVGEVLVKGIKLSLFDVSDVNAPKQIDKYEIRESFDSEALRDHRAFLFDKMKNLLVIPIAAYESRYDEMKKDSNMPYDNIWQGAYVFNITGEGFKLRGKISHDYNYYDKNMYYYSELGIIRRSIYIDDILYTISDIKMKMNNLTNMIEINSIDLPSQK